MSTKSRSILKRDNDNTKRFVAGLKNAVRTFEFTSAASFPAGTEGLLKSTWRSFCDRQTLANVGDAFLFSVRFPFIYFGTEE
ncbi:hypothetical protein TNCT_120911 [Trichonephila clavata]|uniref:Uncharacterized protein n=1 Tax=Trichonephila clavata TaxID=2740835 RepID=A0A8X6L2A9_TRICU|nr:hypothetical protein TNCT_120911 [Trichonephila clavata]